MRAPGRRTVGGSETRFHHGGHRVHGEPRHTPDRAQRSGVRRSSSALPPRSVSHPSSEGPQITQMVEKDRREPQMSPMSADDRRGEGSADTLVRFFCGQALEPRRARRSRREPGSRTRRSASWQGAAAPAPWLLLEAGAVTPLPPSPWNAEPRRARSSRRAVGQGAVLSQDKPNGLAACSPGMPSAASASLGRRMTRDPVNREPCRGSVGLERVASP